MRSPKALSLSSSLLLAAFSLDAIVEAKLGLRFQPDALDVEDSIHHNAVQSENLEKGDYTYWLGGISEDLRILFRCTSHFDQVYAYSLDQGGVIIPASDSHFHDDTQEVDMSFHRIDGSFKGTIVEDNDGQQGMAGWWHQLGQKMPLNLERFQPSETHPVPHELSYLLDKIVTGDSDQLVAMVGYWSGYLHEDEGDTFVVLQIEELAEGLVEPLLFLTDDDEDDDDDDLLPVGLRALVVTEGHVKIVADGSIFEGRFVDDTKLVGVVQLDDGDGHTAPLTLEWTKDKPSSSILGTN